MGIRTPVLIPLLLLSVALVTLIIGNVMRDTISRSDDGLVVKEKEAIHVTAILNIQLVNPETGAIVPNVEMYIKSLQEDHSLISGRFVGEHSVVKLTDANGMVDLTSGYDLNQGESIRFSASYVSFRKEANIIYFRYSEAENQKDDDSNAVTMTKTMLVDYCENSINSDTFPRIPFGK